MRIIPVKESLTAEFKSDLKRLPDAELIEAVVGMANSNGGKLYLGVEDDGIITGIHHQHADPVGVCALIANKTVPALAARADIFYEDGKEILVIDIPMSRAIVASTDGKTLKRRLKLDGTPENTPLYPFEFQTRLSELSLLDFSGQILHEATPEDLDPNERLRLREIIKMRKGERLLLDLTDEELDKALQLVKEENGQLYPTVTGILLIGKEARLSQIMPTAKASFQVLEGTRVRVNEQIVKPLLATFEMIENYVKAWNPERETQSGLFRIPIPEFSEDAFREGLVNAFCHRDYSILQMVRVLIDDEGMTISSPGGFIEGVNLNNLLTVEPHGRNPALADALKRIGLAERTGRGIDRIFEGSIVYGRPLPDYSESTTACVKLFIQRAKPDLAFTQMISNEEYKLGRTLPINSLLILSELQRQRQASIRELANAIHVGEARVKANVESLIETGLIEAVGGGSARTYMLSARVYKEQNNAIGYVRQTGIDREKHRELVLKLAEKQGYVTKKDVCALLDLTGSQAYRLLKQMVDSAQLISTGNARGVKYVITAPSVSHKDNHI